MQAISYRDSDRLRRAVSAAAPERDLIKSAFTDECVRPMFLNRDSITRRDLARRATEPRYCGNMMYRVQYSSIPCRSSAPNRIVRRIDRGIAFHAQRERERESIIYLAH